jgi:hypothetical protein
MLHVRFLRDIHVEVYSYITDHRQCWNQAMKLWSIVEIATERGFPSDHLFKHWPQPPLLNFSYINVIMAEELNLPRETPKRIPLVKFAKIL